MKARSTAVLVLSCGVFALGAGAISQAPDGNKVAGEAAPVSTATYPKPTNLKVLSKDISGADLHKLMRRYTSDLGVPCGYCHEENAQTKKLDFASDENPMKETARFMIKMTDDISDKYLAQLGDRRYADPFTCGNCHQGQVQPPAFEAKPPK